MRSTQKYTRCFILGLQNAMEYRSNFFLSVLSTAFPMTIQLFLWTAVFKHSGGGLVYGYSYQQMITYTILANLISKFLATGIEYEVMSDIKMGGLSKFIVQPINYFGYRVYRFLGTKFPQLFIVSILIFTSLIVLNIFWSIKTEILRIILFVCALLLALMLKFLIFFCLSTFAFWLTDAWGIFFGANFLVNLLSGGVFPLDIFDSRVLAILNFLPFQYAIYYPINVLNGKLNSYLIFDGMIKQILWIVFLALALRVLWQKGMKKYVAVGG